MWFVILVFVGGLGGRWVCFALGYESCADCRFCILDVGDFTGWTVDCCEGFGLLASL